MKFNYKKIASILASAIMLSSTVGFAAAASYPTPFVSGGTADGVVVVGANGNDWMAAIDVAQKLSSQVSTTTATTGATATGGDSVNLASSSKLNYLEDLNDGGRTSITSTEMPTLLKSGTFTDDGGTSYTYSQSITVGSSKIEFGTSGGDMDDPIVHVQVGTDAASPLYTYKMNLYKNLDISNSTVKGNDVEILGQKYTIGAGSSTNGKKLVLFGAGVQKTLKEGESTEVTIGGNTHTVTITSITQLSTTNSVYVSVDGGTATSIAQDASARVGGLDIYAKTVIYSAKESTQNSATVSIGSSKITIENGQKVTYGANDDVILGTNCTVASTSTGISSVQVDIAKQKSTQDYLANGDSFVDPVFGGLKVNLVGVVPTLDDTAREEIVIDTDNNLQSKITFATMQSPSTPYTLTYAYDNDTVSTTVWPTLAHASNTNGRNMIQVVEGAAAHENDFYVVNEGDKGMILRIDSIAMTSGSSSNKVVLSDVITGTSYPITLGTGGDTASAVSIGGGQYYLNATPVNVTITWGTGASANNAGTYTTLYPRIQLKNGEFMAILSQYNNLTNNTKYILPDGAETLATTGSELGYTNTTLLEGRLVANINWTVTGIGAKSDANNLILGKLSGISTDSDNAPECNFSNTTGPTILIMEEKKNNDTSYGDFICIPLSTSGTSPMEIAVGEPVFKDTGATFTTKGTDSYKKQALDRYGVFVEYDSSSGTNNKATIKYPNSEMYVDVLFAADAATITPGSAGGNGGQVLVVKDNEVSSYTDKNLLVVGGSCINSVAAKILGSDTPLCAADFTAKTKVGANGYIIKTVASPYNAAKVATLVAGYNKEQTEQAVAALKLGATTDVGSETVYPTVSA